MRDLIFFMMIQTILYVHFHICRGLTAFRFLDLEQLLDTI